MIVDYLMSNVGTLFAKKSLNIFKQISFFSFRLHSVQMLPYETIFYHVNMLQYQENAIYYFFMTTFFPLKGYFQKQNLVWHFEIWYTISAIFQLTLSIDELADTEPRFSKHFTQSCSYTNMTVRIICITKNQSYFDQKARIKIYWFLMRAS